MMTLSGFIAKYTNQAAVGDTDANKGECVGLVEVWTDNLGLPHDWGNAKDLLANAPRDAYQVILNNPKDLNQFPLSGDVLCLNWGLYGHTGVVISADGNTYTLFEQNNPLGSTPHIVHHLNYNGVIGWMRGLNVKQPADNHPLVQTSAQSDDETRALQVLKHWKVVYEIGGNLEGFANLLCQDAYPIYKNPAIVTQPIAQTPNPTSAIYPISTSLWEAIKGLFGK